MQQKRKIKMFFAGGRRNGEVGKEEREGGGRSELEAELSSLNSPALGVPSVSVTAALRPAKPEQSPLPCVDRSA